MSDSVIQFCFLVATGPALVEVCHKLWCWKPKLITWRIAAVNMIGSIAFGVSAVGAFVVPETGELNNAAVANTFSFIGAVMFFIGAVLLIPAMTMTPPAVARDLNGCREGLPRPWCA